MTEKEIEYIKDNLSYDPDTGHFWWKKKGFSRRFGLPVGHGSKNGYCRVGIMGKKFYAHRLAFVLMEGHLPEEVDHINCDKSDNRWSNLRASNTKSNSLNKTAQSNNSCGYKGVHFAKDKSRWVARITVNGVKKHLGYYSTPEEAHQEYVKASKELHGEFSYYAK